MGGRAEQLWGGRAAVRAGEQLPPSLRARLRHRLQSLAAAALLGVSLSLMGCAGLRAGEFSYDGPLQAADRERFAQGYRAWAGLPPLWCAAEYGRLVPAAGPGGAPAHGGERSGAAQQYEARLAAYTALGLLTYRTQIARWSEGGALQVRVERTAYGAGLLATHELTLHHPPRPGAAPLAVHDWRFLLGLVGYREEGSRRVLTILGLPIPLPARPAGSSAAARRNGQQQQEP
ncbi:MAG: hypothetical protein KatS3mg102_0550 [Planctomycetota bacterium]|nr:MAG: hypothetical protein KatS3mg102_0550 [Planctomycetota bacterium]